jgi:hypothetical protein
MNMNIEKTNREYTDFWTKEKFVLCNDLENEVSFLLNEITGQKVRRFLTTAQPEIKYRFYDKSEITLNAGVFYEYDKLNPPIARKVIGYNKKFVKI